MFESTEDLERIDRLLDSSYERAGSPLRHVITPSRRLTAEQVSAMLQGMRLLVLATVTRDCRPIAGPVDGFFLRGDFYFGSAPASVRISHIRERPSVSATHLPSEELSITVHGRATLIDLRSPQHDRFRQLLIDTYAPSFPDYEATLDSGTTYARIDAERMYTFYLPADHPDRNAQ